MVLTHPTGSVDSIGVLYFIQTFEWTDQSDGSCAQNNYPTKMYVGIVKKPTSTKILTTCLSPKKRLPHLFMNGTKNKKKKEEKKKTDVSYQPFPQPLMKSNPNRSNGENDKRFSYSCVNAMEQGATGVEHRIGEEGFLPIKRFFSFFQSLHT